MMRNLMILLVVLLIGAGIGVAVLSQTNTPSYPTISLVRLNHITHVGNGSVRVSMDISSRSDVGGFLIKVFYTDRDELALDTIHIGIQAMNNSRDLYFGVRGLPYDTYRVQIFTLDPGGEIVDFDESTLRYYSN